MFSRKLFGTTLSLVRRQTQQRCCISSFNGNQRQKFEEDYGGDLGEKIRLPPCQMPNMLDIGSRSIFDEDHDIFRSSVRRFMRDELAPNHKHYEEQGHVDRHLWKQA